MIKFYPSRSHHLYAPDGMRGGRRAEQYDLFAAFVASTPAPGPAPLAPLESAASVEVTQVAPPSASESVEVTGISVADIADQPAESPLQVEIITGTPPAVTPLSAEPSVVEEQPIEAPALPAATQANLYPPTPRVRATLPNYAWGLDGQDNSSWQRQHLNRAAQANLNEVKQSSIAPTDDQLQAMARYTGTGGAGNSLNEYYTPEAIADAMWGLAHKAGFAGGLVLEPSCGTGVFLRTASDNAQVVAVEMSEISAGIAEALHAPGGHEIIHSSFEEMARSDPREFDLVIGNPPFGVRGATVRDHKRDIATAQEYFLDTALDKCRPGGLVAFVLPTGVMDNANMRQFRSDLMLKAELVSAWRLPNAVFRPAGTNIPTDILLLRRRDPEITMAARHLDADRREQIGIWDEEFWSGDYFKKAGVGNVLGQVEAGWRARNNMGDDIDVIGSLETAIEALNAWEPSPPAPPVSLDAVFGAAPSEAIASRMRQDVLAVQRQQAVPGAIRVLGGVRYVLQQFPDEAARWVSAPAEVPESIRSAYEIGRDVHHLSVGGRGGVDRHEIIARLDMFQASFGDPGSNAEIQSWMRAPYWDYEPGLTREEIKDHVLEARRMIGMAIGAVLPNGAGYSDLLTGTQREAPQLDIKGAIVVAAAATERFTADAVARLVGNTQSEVSAILLEGDDYAVLPDGATWESKDKYYSGELWPKYDAAMAASTNTASPEWLRQRLATQAARLHEKIAPIGLEQVEIQMNSGFITPDDLTAWLEDRPRHHVGSSHDTPQPAYVTFEDAVYTITPAHATNWLSNDNKLITAYLNREGVKKDEIGAVELLNAEFRLWVLGGPHRDAIENRYNRTYRGFAQREYSSEPISIPGLNPDRSLNGYHYAALRWAIEMGGGISAYDVGLGKTTFGLILSRLSVAMGRAERPAFVVPLSVISNWEAEAKSWFPGCTTMVIGETRVTKKDGTISAKSDSAAVIRTKLLQAQQNNVDFVFITEPAWNRLDLNPEKKAALVDQDFWVQRGNTLGHAGTKRQNKVKEQFKQAAAARDFDAREDTLYFEDLKFDMLVVDEMHRYKNLYSPRNRWGGAPKYLGGSGQSNRAHDTYLKAAELRERTGGLNIFGLTASPSKNSPLEIYSLMSLVSPEAFDRMGIRNSEEFLDRFCTFEIQPILNLQGEIEEATVVSGFKNLDELLPIMERFIYRKTAEDVGLKIPDAEPVVHITDMTDTQAKVYEEIREKMASKAEDSSDIHIFRALDLMGKASIDLALIDPVKYKDEPSPLINACVDAATLDFQANGGGQIIFCDHILVHEKIKAELVKRGVAPERIVIMNATTVPRSEDRYRASEDFNAGKYDFVIGNPPVIGEAVNLQQNTGGSHVLGIPWEPEALKQMRGRARRQGNHREVVQEHIYFDKGGCSAYRFQILEGKNDWVQVLWSGEKQAENPARTGGFSRMDLLIMLAPDPVAARAKYEADIQAAEERHAMAARRKAGEDFRRLQEIQASLRTINTVTRESETGQRMARSEEVLRDKLLHSQNFGPKSSLIDAAKSLYFPSKDMVLTTGDMVVRQPGETGYSNPFVEAITEVDWKAQTITLVATNTITKRNPTPIQYRDLEEKLNASAIGMAPEGTPSREVVIAAALREPPNSFKSISIETLKGLRTFSDDWLVENQEGLTRHARHCADRYRLEDKLFPYIDGEGNIGLTGRFGISEEFKKRHVDLLLPTMANLTKLRDYSIRVDRAFVLGSQMPFSGGRNTEPTLTAVYGNFPREIVEGGVHSNPAFCAINLLYGKEEYVSALSAAHEDAKAMIKTAANPAEALVNAARMLSISSYTKKLTWTEEALVPLAERLAELAVLDTELQNAIAFRSNTNKEGLSKAYLGQQSLVTTMRRYLMDAAPTEQLRQRIFTMQCANVDHAVDEGVDVDVGP